MRCPPHVLRLAKRVRANLTEELRQPRFRGKPFPVGHCYVASEALYHLLGGKRAGWTPRRVTHEGGTHWYLTHRSGCVLDTTADQFCAPVPRHLARGAGFLTKRPSKRAQELMKRVRRGR